MVWRRHANFAAKIERKDEHVAHLTLYSLQYLTIYKFQYRIHL
jgi:hypothetical protein